MGDGRWWIGATDLDAVLDALAREGTLIAPVRAGGEVLFRRVARVGDVCRDYVNTLVPPKRFFLPTPEQLFHYHFDHAQPAMDPADGGPDRPAWDTGPFVLFGVRSCDVAGLAYLERFLSGAALGRPETADIPFLERRRRATILSVVCQDPAETCMCVCCQGGPALTEGFDWQLTQLADGWLVEVGGPNGAALAERFADRLRPASGSAVHEKEARVQRVIERFREHSTRRVQTMTAGRMLSRGSLEHPFWNDVGERCFECGGCAFVCPTCYCFNVVDTLGAGDGEPTESEEGVAPATPGGPIAAPQSGTFHRDRYRDCCMLAGFVRQAGGGYPRWDCGERCLTRFFHKLSWQFFDRMDMLGCTGCGRCALVCLGGIGIDAVSEMMAQALMRKPADRTAPVEQPEATPVPAGATP